MTLKTLTMAASVAILASCSSNHDNSPPIAHSGQSVSSVSVETKARLEKIQKDYGVGVDIYDHRIVVRTVGLITTSKQIEDALHKAFGDDFTNYTIIFDIN